VLFAVAELLVLCTRDFAFLLVTTPVTSILLCNGRHPDLHDSTVAENKQPVLLAFLPFFHVFGMLSTMIFPLAVGIQIVTLPRYNLKEVLRCTEKYKVNDLFMSLLIYVIVRLHQHW